jgi:MFS family permease
MKVKLMGARSLLRRLFSSIAGPLRREFWFITGNYRILLISWVIMDLAMEMPQPNYQLYVQNVLGGKDFPMALGLIGCANFFAMAAVAFPGGYLADKYGRRWLITTMTFGLALSFLFYVFAPSWHFVLIGATLQGLCLIYQPALFAMVQDSLPPKRIGTGSSLIQMIHGTFNTPGPIIGGLLLLAFGLEWSMRMIYMIVTILYLIAATWRLRLKETIANVEPMHFRYFISSYPKAIKESFGVWKVVPRSVLWLFFVQVCVMFSTALVNVINALYAVNVLGIPEEQWFLTFIPLLLTMVVISIPVGKMVDRIGTKIPLILGPIVLATALLLFVNGNFYTIMISMALLGLVHLLVMSSGMVLAATLVAPENRGKVRGFLNFVGNIFTGVGMLLGNFLYNIMPQLPFYVTALLAIPMVLIAILFIHEPKKQSAAREIIS